MTDKKIESYIVMDEDNVEFTGLKPGYSRIPHNEFAHHIGWGLYQGEEWVLEELHKKGTPQEKEWIEDVFTDINFHPEAAALQEGDYEEFEIISGKISKAYTESDLWASALKSEGNYGDN